MPLACTGAVNEADIASGHRFVSHLLAPLGLSITTCVPAAACGFTYIVYLPKAHREGHTKFLYAGGSMKHPHGKGRSYFGSCRERGYAERCREAAIRFVIETTPHERDLVNVAERRLLSGLDAAEDPRFWNRHNGAGAGWGREVAVAAWKDPAFRAAASERARKAAATRRARRKAIASDGDATQQSNVDASEPAETSARRRKGALKAWNNPAFRAGGSERARKAAATLARKRLHGAK